MRRLALLAAAAAFVALPAAAQIVGTTADFTFSPTSPRAGETVTFTDKSLGSIFGWYWNFGDGSTSGQQNPTHAFSSPGVYAITLAVLDRSLAETSVTKTVSVAPSGAAGADFRFDPVLPAVGQSVQFTDQSSGSPTAWAWDFGDGGASAQQNPTHAFATAAEFAVRLTVSTSSGTTSVTKSVSVQPSGVSAAFAFFPQQPSIGDVVNFQNLSTGSPTSFSWDFGDGASSTENSPTHLYEAAGSFQVTLTASTATASDTATQTVVVSTASSGSFTIRLLDVFELPSETTNGNGHPEPGERIGVHLALANGTTRTVPSVIAQLLPWTWCGVPAVDMIDFGTVPAGAAAALADGRFEILVGAGWGCDAHLELYVRLLMPGRATEAGPVDLALPNGPACDPPAFVVPSIVIDEPPSGTTFAIGAPAALGFTVRGSVPTGDVRIELSRDGGATFPEVLTEGANELTGIGPHVFFFSPAGTPSTRVRFRATVALDNGGSISAITSHDVAFAENAPRRVAHLPVVVQSAGAHQTFWSTEATIASPDGPAAVLLTFTPIGGEPVTLANPIPVPRGSLFLPDVFQQFREEGLVPESGLVGTFSASAFGSAAPILSARVTNLPKSGVGSFGLAFDSRP